MRLTSRAADERLLRVIKAYEAGFTTREIADASGAILGTIRTMIDRIRTADATCGEDVSGFYVGKPGKSAPLSDASRAALAEFIHG